MAKRANDPIEVRVCVEAAPEAVFEYLIDESKLTRWLADNVRADARPEGEFRIEASGGEVVSGRYVEVVPHEKVVFTWGWESMFPNIPPGSTTVEITLKAEGDRTLVEVRHRDLPDGTAQKHETVWKKVFSQLQRCFSTS